MDLRFCPCCRQHHHEADIVNQLRSGLFVALIEHTQNLKVRESLNGFLRDLGLE